MLTQIIIFLLSTAIVLVLSAIIVKQAVNLGKILGLGIFTLSFILLAFATSIPELIIGLMASAADRGSLAVGVALGSNIINLTLITGIIALLTKGVRTDNQYRNRQAMLLLFIVAFAIFALVDGNLTRYDGLILITSYVLYLFELWYSQAKETEKKVKLHYTLFLSVISTIIACIVGLIFAADALVTSSLKISAELFITPFVAGVLLIAGATAAPELIYEYSNIKYERERFALGDLIGAVGTNSSLILGLIAVINPFTFVVTSTIYVTLFFFGASMIIFLSFLFSRKMLEMKEGIYLIFMYVAFLFALFLSTLAQI